MLLLSKLDSDILININKNKTKRKKKQWETNVKQNKNIHFRYILFENMYRSGVEECLKM